ncbi:MAG: hypothetical protein E6G68_07965, partial [Actinobacteria bacterium]
MNFDDKIKEAFERHERDVQAQPGAWNAVERRIARSHRGRLIAAGIGTALAIGGAAIALPRLGSRQAPLPPPLASSGSPTATEATATRPHLVHKIRIPAYRLAAGANSLWGLTPHNPRQEV